ncbi:MAG: YfiR family protein [Pseudomonadota bacterium]
MSRTQAVWLAVILGLAGNFQGFGAEVVPENALKVAFIFNFVGFIEWPAATGPALNLCVVGKDPFGTALDTLAGKSVGTRTIQVMRLPGRQDVRRCQILFISPSEKNEVTSLLAALEGNSTLTASDTDGLVRQGVMIGLELEQKRVVFDVNLEAARRAGLSISSKLLRLAKKIY